MASNPRDPVFPAAGERAQASPQGLALLEALLEGSRDLIVAIGPDRKVTALNSRFEQAFARLYGRSLRVGDELLMARADLPGEQQRLAQLWSRALAGERFIVDEKLGDPRFTRRRYRARFAPVGDGAGGWAGAVLIAQDLGEDVRRQQGAADLAQKVGERVAGLEQSNEALLREVQERRRVQEMLHASERHLWSVVSGAHVPMLAHAEDGEVLAVSDGLVRITGYSRDRIKHIWDWLELAYGNRAADVDEIIRAHFATQRPASGLELEVRTAAGLRTWIFNSAPPQRLTDGRRYYVVSAEDVTDRRAAEAALRQSEKQAREQLHELETVYRVAPIGLSLLDRDLRFVRISETLARVDGCSVGEHIGRSVREVLPGLADIVEPRMRQVIATGEPLYDWEVAGAAPTETGAERHWLVSYFPLLDERGGVRAVGAIVRDITERRQAEEQREMLLAELAHRVKNTLASVQAIATQTLVEGKDLRQAREEFIGRLLAMSNVHNVLADCDWRGAALDQVVRAALKPFIGAAGERASVGGADFMLKPRAALTLSMTINELATNAAKYGALTRADGRIDLHWWAELEGGGAGAGSGEDRDRRMLCLDWVERNGPPVHPPARTGFGRKMIESGLAHELDGVAGMEFRPEGLRCSMRIPFARAVRTS